MKRNAQYSTYRRKFVKSVDLSGFLWLRHRRFVASPPQILADLRLCRWILADLFVASPLQIGADSRLCRWILADLFVASPPQIGADLRLCRLDSRRFGPTNTPPTPPLSPPPSRGQAWQAPKIPPCPQNRSESLLVRRSDLSTALTPPP